jgi:hypothetical protein
MMNVGVKSPVGITHSNEGEFGADYISKEVGQKFHFNISKLIKNITQGVRKTQDYLEIGLIEIRAITWIFTI